MARRLPHLPRPRPYGPCNRKIFLDLEAAGGDMIVLETTHDLFARFSRSTPTEPQLASEGRPNGINRLLTESYPALVRPLLCNHEVNTQGTYIRNARNRFGQLVLIWQWS
jgi:hypothetical protein